MRIRRLAPSDWTLLREVRLASLADSPEAFGSTYARELAFDEAEWRRRARSGAWYVAADDWSGDGSDDRPGDGSDGRSDHSAAGIVAGYHDAESSEQRRDLIAMWVAPQARGTGLAADLVGAVVCWARTEGATELTLGVAEGNDRARAFYLRCGFVPTGESFPLHSESSRNMDIYRLPL